MRVYPERTTTASRRGWRPLGTSVPPHAFLDLPLPLTHAAIKALKALHGAGMLDQAWLPITQKTARSHGKTPSDMLLGFAPVARQSIPVFDSQNRALRRTISLVDGPVCLQVPAPVPAAASTRHGHTPESIVLHLYALHVGERRLCAAPEDSNDSEAGRAAEARDAIDATSLGRVGLLFPNRLGEEEVREAESCTVMLHTGTEVAVQLRHVCSGSTSEDSDLLRTVYAMHATLFTHIGDTAESALAPARLAMRLLCNASPEALTPEMRPGRRWYLPCLLRSGVSAQGASLESAVDEEAMRALAMGAARLRHHVTKHRRQSPESVEAAEDFEDEWDDELSRDADNLRTVAGAVCYVTVDPAKVVACLRSSEKTAGSEGKFIVGKEEVRMTHKAYFEEKWDARLDAGETMMLATSRGCSKMALRHPTGKTLRDQNAVRYPPSLLEPLCSSDVLALSFALPPYLWRLEAALVRVRVRVRVKVPRGPVRGRSRRLLLARRVLCRGRFL